MPPKRGKRSILESIPSEESLNPIESSSRNEVDLLMSRFSVAKSKVDVDPGMAAMRRRGRRSSVAVGSSIQMFEKFNRSGLDPILKSQGQGVPSRRGSVDDMVNESIEKSMGERKMSWKKLAPRLKEVEPPRRRHRTNPLPSRSRSRAKSVCATTDSVLNSWQMRSKYPLKKGDQSEVDLVGDLELWLERQLKEVVRENSKSEDPLHLNRAKQHVYNAAFKQLVGQMHSTDSERARLLADIWREHSVLIAEAERAAAVGRLKQQERILKQTLNRGAHENQSKAESMKSEYDDRLLSLEAQNVTLTTQLEREKVKLEVANARCDDAMRLLERRHDRRSSIFDEVDDLKKEIQIMRSDSNDISLPDAKKTRATPDADLLQVLNRTAEEEPKKNVLGLPTI